MSKGNHITILSNLDISACLAKTTRQYLVGNLKRPQPLRAIPDDHIEIGISESKGEDSVDLKHFHPIVTEYQYVLEGTLDLKELDAGIVHHLVKGDFFIIYPNTKYQGVLHPHSKVLFIKYPGMNDKTLIQ